MEVHLSLITVPDRFLAHSQQGRSGSLSPEPDLSGLLADSVSYFSPLLGQNSLQCNLWKSFFWLACGSALLMVEKAWAKSMRKPREMNSHSLLSVA